jgi:hypothetical protein
MNHKTHPHLISKRGFSLRRPICDLQRYARTLIQLTAKHGPETYFARDLADVIDEIQERRGGPDWRGEDGGQ